MKYQKIILILVLVVLLFVVFRGYQGRQEMNDVAGVPMPLPAQQAGSDTNMVVSPGTYTATLMFDGVERDYIIHIPTGYTSDKQFPLVVLLHGGGGENKNTFDNTRFGPKADQEGFIVVAPNGIDKNWNDGRGSTARERTSGTVIDTDDVGFIAALITELEQMYAIDTDRVYATGISNGALMSQYLACKLPDTFAAIAPASGPMLEVSIAGTCTDGQPIAVLGMQGTEDPFFPIYDDDGIPDMPRILTQQGIPQTPVTVDEITAFWTTKNNCSPDAAVTTLPDTAKDGTIVTKYAFSGCVNGTDVVYYIIDNAGHGWPGGTGMSAMLVRINGGRTDNLNATDVVWDFFAAHALP